MRTTVTLDEDLAARLREIAHRRDISFKKAINEAIRRGIDLNENPKPFVQRTYNLGKPLVDLTKAGQLAAQLDDAVIIEKMKQGR